MYHFFIKYLCKFGLAYLYLWGLLTAGVLIWKNNRADGVKFLYERGIIMIYGWFSNRKGLHTQCPVRLESFLIRGVHLFQKAIQVDYYFSHQHLDAFSVFVVVSTKAGWSHFRYHSACSILRGWLIPGCGWEQRLFRFKYSVSPPGDDAPVFSGGIEKWDDDNKPFKIFESSFLSWLRVFHVRYMASIKTTGMWNAV